MDAKTRTQSVTRGGPKQAGPAAAGPFLEKLYRNYNQSRYLASDPLSIPHRYEDPADQEVAAFFAALFAYGSAPLIINAVSRILEPLGPHPAAALRAYRGEALWPGFYYRFHTEHHVMVLAALVQRLWSHHGSLQEVFRPEKGATVAMESALHGAWGKVQDELASLGAAVELRRGLRFLFNTPETGSACKRLVMFLRWMVRTDGVDLGLWSVLTPADLVMPLDTHTARLSHYLGLRDSPEDRAPHWGMALQVTEGLRAVDPVDPVRFDFALSRLGILSLCQRRFEHRICGQCDLEPACRYSKIRIKP